jgi:tetratricopeptide (TPR) repeat protein
VLADYVYHLARACLEVAAASQTRTRDPALYPPPGVAQCSAMVKKLDSRGSFAEQISQKTQLLEAISGTGSIRQSESCIEVLRKLEGRSARADFLSARCSLLREDYARVVEILTPMLGMNVPGWLWLAIRWHLMSAFLRSGRASEALKIGQQAVKVRPEDRSLLYNLATAHASLGDEQGFDRVVTQFATSAAVDDGRNWRGIIELDADWFAARIDRSKEQILRAFAHTGGGGLGP